MHKMRKNYKRHTDRFGLLNKRLEPQIEKHGQVLCTFLNLYSYLYYRKNISLFKSFNKINIDGIMLVYLCNIVGIKTERKSFDMTSLAPIVFNDCIQNCKTIYFIGSTEKSINDFKSVVNDKYSDLKVLGFRNGYFENEDERKKTIANLLHLNPDVIVVGMGTPYQEQFLVDLKSNGWEGFGYTCGGFIHQTAKGINYYPEFFNRYNLRWLYRIWDEPMLFTRYLLYYPIAFWLFFWDYMVFRLINKQVI